MLDRNNVSPVIKSEILIALKICLEQYYIEFDDKIYTCNNWLIMGNPLLAKAFMDDIESEIH